MLRPRDLGIQAEGRQRWTRLVHVLDSALGIFRVINHDLLSTPSATILCDLLHVVEGEPAWALDFPLQDEELQHALICAKYRLECVACQVVWQRRASSRVLDLKHTVFSMRQWRFKAVLATDALAFPLGDLSEPTLAHLLELGEHVGE